MTMFGGVPCCHTAVAVPSEATNRSGLPPAPSGIASAAVHGWPGALVATLHRARLVPDRGDPALRVDADRAGTGLTGARQLLRRRPGAVRLTRGDTDPEAWRAAVGELGPDQRRDPGGVGGDAGGAVVRAGLRERLRRPPRLRSQR